MQRCPLAHQLHLRPLGIAMYLRYCILPLGFTFDIIVLGRKIFQLQNVAVLHFGITLQVRHQEHITKAVVQFHFGGSKIISIYTKVGLEETLNVTLTFNQATHGRIFLVVMGHLL